MYEGCMQHTKKICLVQAMDALTEEKAEERAAFQEQLAQLEADQALALQQAGHRQDQALLDIRRHHEDEKRELRQQLELEHELEFDAFKQKYTTGELNKVNQEQFFFI